LIDLHHDVKEWTELNKTETRTMYSDSGKQKSM